MRKSIIIFLIIFTCLMSACRQSGTAYLMLEGQYLIGTEVGGKTVIFAAVRNTGTATALASSAFVQPIDLETGEQLGSFEAKLGKIKPGELREFSVWLEGIDWGADIECKINLIWY